MPKHCQETDAAPLLLNEAHKKPVPQESSWAAEEFRFGSFVLRTDRRELHHEGTLRPMERRCFDLLVYLLRNAGRVVSKDELLDHVWANRFVSLSVIAQSVLKVRKALRVNADHGDPLRTVHRIGYRIVGDVQRRRIMPTESALPAGAATWQWRGVTTQGESFAPGWTASALDAFGMWSLRSHGVDVRDASRVSAADDDVVTGCRVVSEDDGSFNASIEMADATGDVHRLQVSAESPFEAVWRSAGAAALLAQLKVMVLACADTDQRRYWEQLAVLPQPVAPGMAHTIAPLSSAWADLLPACGPRLLADLLMEAGWRDDRAVPAEIWRLEESCETQALWAHLCLAMMASHRGDGATIRWRIEHALHLLPGAVSDEASHRPLSIAVHLLCLAHTAPPEIPAWRLWVTRLPHSLPLPSRRWWLLAALEYRMVHPEDPSVYLDADVVAQSLAAPIEDGLQALLLNLQGQHCEFEGDLDGAMHHQQLAADMTMRCPWIGVRPLCLLSLGNLAARLNDAPTLDACLRSLDSMEERDRPQLQAVRAWLRARRLRMESRPAEALELVEQALSMLPACGIWMRDDAWLFAIEVALHARSRAALLRWRAALEDSCGRARSAMMAAVDASVSLLEGDRLRARQLMVRAWQVAPTSISKRLLAMAAATALRWGTPEGRHEWAQAMGQAGAWAERTRNGRRLNHYAHAPGVHACLHGEGQGIVAESDADPFWLWPA